MEILGAFRGFWVGLGIRVLGKSMIFWGATEGSGLGFGAGSGLGFGAGRKTLQVIIFGFPSSSLNSILNQRFEKIRRRNATVYENVKMKSTK